jgi:multidrug efflux system membrane fusion protein
MANPDAKIADGVTCEMVVTLDPIEAASVPRSALVFSDAGELGVRVADEKNTARFMPIAIVDDGREAVWVTGIAKPTRVIVVGQDFVKDGDPVDAVSAADAETKTAPKA